MEAVAATAEIGSGTVASSLNWAKTFLGLSNSQKQERPSGTRPPNSLTACEIADRAGVEKTAAQRWVKKAVASGDLVKTYVRMYVNYNNRLFYTYHPKNGSRFSGLSPWVDAFIAAYRCGGASPETVPPHAVSARTLIDSGQAASIHSATRALVKAHKQGKLRRAWVVTKLPNADGVRKGYMYWPKDQSIEGAQS